MRTAWNALRLGWLLIALLGVGSVALAAPATACDGGDAACADVKDCTVDGAEGRCVRVCSEVLSAAHQTCTTIAIAKGARN